MATEGARILQVMLGTLNPVVRAGIERRFEAMLRELRFLRERNNEELSYLHQKGWFEEKLQVLFLLNSVYQHCIGPMHASARSTAGLGSDIPIRHGAEVFGTQRATAVSGMSSDFFALVAELGLSRDWMTKNTCGDLVYWIARHERDLDAMRGS